MKYTLFVGGRAFPFSGDCVAAVDTGAIDIVRARLRNRHLDIGTLIESGTRWLVFQEDSGQWLLATEPYQAVGLPSGSVSEEVHDSSIFLYENQTDLVEGLLQKNSGRRVSPYRGLLDQLGIEPDLHEDEEAKPPRT